MNLAPGDRVDRYVLQEALGEGGQGSVWRAEDRLAPGELRALKLVASHRAGSPQVERLRREARALAELDHPTLVHCYGLFEDLSQGVLGIAMDFVDGPSLRALSGDARMTREHASAALLQVAEALAYLHRRGVLHRDVKGANVVIADAFWREPSAPGTVRLVDFGLTSLENNPDPLTAVGHVLGTISHMAPELLDKSSFAGETARPTVDVFAFGVMGWQLLGGTHPTGLPVGSTVVDYAMAYRSAAEAGGDWPATALAGPWAAVLRRCLTLRAAERLPDALAIVAACREAAGGGPVPSLRLGEGREASPLSAARTQVDGEALTAADASVASVPTQRIVTKEAPKHVDAPGPASSSVGRAAAVGREVDPEARGKRSPMAFGLAAVVLVAGGGYAALRATGSTAGSGLARPEVSLVAPPVEPPAELEAAAAQLPASCRPQSPLCECCPSGRDCGPGACDAALEERASWYLTLGALSFESGFDTEQLRTPELCVRGEAEQPACFGLALSRDAGREAHLEEGGVMMGPVTTEQLREGTLQLVVRDEGYSPVPLATGKLAPARDRSALCAGLQAKLQGVVDQLQVWVEPDPPGGPRARCE